MNITLRIWKQEDAHLLTHYFNNINIWNNLRDSIPNPYSFSDAEDFISKQNNLFPIQNFAIENNNELVGGIGMILLEDIYKMNVELGYWIAEPFWGQGFATEAIRQMTYFIFENYAINRIVAEVFENNKPSMRALEKNAYHLEAVKRKGILKNDKLLDSYIWVIQKVY